MKKWEIQSNKKFALEKGKYAAVINVLLENRGIKTEHEKEQFLHPKLEDITTRNVGFDQTQLTKTIKRLKHAYAKNELIVVFGDYDVDGITGTAILWETLHQLGFNALPYIPHRVDEGYGLSIKGIDNAKTSICPIKLIVTVDNGIVAHEAVEYANSLGIDVIITDHHLPEKGELPNAYSIVHTTKLCGAGVAWLLAKQMKQLKLEDKKEEYEIEDTRLELAALGTIADLVPLTGANRAIVTYGLEKLRQTKRLGLRALFTEAGISADTIGTYEAGYIIAPRLNAAGRIESAMDSLRLVCTGNVKKAFELAKKLGQTNRQRQDIMQQTTKHALASVQNGNFQKLIFIGHETYNPGVIGLVAGKLVETFYRPAIVLSIGDEYAKASVRSIAGVNIIEFLRKFPDMYVNIGGHPMAAGFTVSVDKLSQLQEKLERLANEVITDDMLQKTLFIDCEIQLTDISFELYNNIYQLAPFGMANPEPVFMSQNITIEDMQILGRERNHLKLRLSERGIGNYEAIGFGMAEFAESLQVGDRVDIAYSIDKNIWNGNVSLQLKLKDIHE